MFEIGTISIGDILNNALGQILATALVVSLVTIFGGLPFQSERKVNPGVGSGLTVGVLHTVLVSIMIMCALLMFGAIGFWLNFGYQGHGILKALAILPVGVVMLLIWQTDLPEEKRVRAYLQSIVVSFIVLVALLSAALWFNREIPGYFSVVFSLAPQDAIDQVRKLSYWVVYFCTLVPLVLLSFMFARLWSKDKYLAEGLAAPAFFVLILSGGVGIAGTFGPHIKGPAKNDKSALFLPS